MSIAWLDTSIILALSMSGSSTNSSRTVAMAVITISGIKILSSATYNPIKIIHIGERKLFLANILNIVIIKAIATVPTTPTFAGVVIPPSPSAIPMYTNRGTNRRVQSINL